jgi:methylmalonyl-CoA/ethylmalonyl-CoA epimerase
MIGPAHHVGIAIRHLEDGVAVYRALGLEPAAVEDIPSEGVRAAFLRAGGIQIELLESLAPDGVIARFIERRGEGLHHLAFATDDIRAAMTLLQSSGLELVDSEPRRGAHGRLVAFVHPRTANGVLIELVQESGSSRGTASQRD